MLNLYIDFTDCFSRNWLQCFTFLPKCTIRKTGFEISLLMISFTVIKASHVWTQSVIKRVNCVQIESSTLANTDKYN